MEYTDFYKEFGPLGYLANYSNHGFFKNGVYYKTVEHYYQSEKFEDLDLKNKIINADTPKEASNIGRDRGNKRIDNFKSIKNKVMYDGIYEKFFQNKDIRNKLIGTGNTIIREMTIDEYYWGVGKDLSGQNNIGKILMKVRDKLRKEVLDTMINDCFNKDVVLLTSDLNSFDSIFSSNLLLRIFNKLGIKCMLISRDDFSFEIDPNKYYFLINHNKLNGIPKEMVVGCIDNHELTGEFDNVISINYSSFSLVIYYLFNDKYDFSKEEKELILKSIIQNTF